MHLQKKVNLFLQRRAVRIISNFYFKVIERRTEDALQEALDRQIFAMDNIEEFENINLDESAELPDAFKDSSDDYEWDNYGSAPNLSGSTWNHQNPDAEPLPIETQ